jgi:hypothetical protein
MIHVAILGLLIPLIFIGIIICGWVKWKGLPTWLKGGLVGITSYWFLFILAGLLISFSKVDPNVLHNIMAAPALPFTYLFLLFARSEFHQVTHLLVGSPVILGVVGILIGLSVGKFKKRSSVKQST